MRNKIIVNAFSVARLANEMAKSGHRYVQVSIFDSENDNPALLAMVPFTPGDDGIVMNYEPIEAVPNEAKIIESDIWALHIDEELL